jgi:putative phosphoribosyl transferase
MEAQPTTARFQKRGSKSMHYERSEHPGSKTVEVPVNSITISGDLTIPDGASGLVIFAHGSGSSRFSRRNRYVASVLNDAGMATLLLDLLTSDEEQIDLRTRELRFNIGLLAERLAAASEWAESFDQTRDLVTGYFGASTGAAAALVAAARRPRQAFAVVSRGGRPDLAGSELRHVSSPTLLIVGGRDDVVLDLNRAAMQELAGKTELTVVPGATHLFEEPGTLESVAKLASDWFLEHLSSADDSQQ